jgi:hypothetical protein
MEASKADTLAWGTIAFGGVTPGKDDGRREPDHRASKTRTTVGGNAVNVCHEGLMVESFLCSGTALKVFKALKKQPSQRLEVEFTYSGDTDLRDVEVKHFHLDFSGAEAYRLTVGFYLPRDK